VPRGQKRIKLIGVAIMQDVRKTSTEKVTALIVSDLISGKIRYIHLQRLPDTQSLLRLCPLGFLPLGADRTALCGARTDQGIGTLAT
jgi:hypothetical protein